MCSEARTSSRILRTRQGVNYLRVDTAAQFCSTVTPASASGVPRRRTEHNLETGGAVGHRYARRRGGGLDIERRAPGCRQHLTTVVMVRTSRVRSAGVSKHWIGRCAGRSPHWIKVKNREHPAMERVMESFS
jgi:hypothetical protein